MNSIGAALLRRSRLTSVYPKVHHYHNFPVVGASSMQSSQVHKRGYRKGREPLDGLPERVDWREHGAVTTVKDQGPYDNCFAFPVVETVEGILKIRTGSLVKLSPQELVDHCSMEGEKDGGGEENGGADIRDCFHYIQKNEIAFEKDYAYKGIINKVESPLPKRAVRIRGVWTIYGERSLMKAVAKQPVCVSVACDNDFDNYDGGILKTRSPLQWDPTDHELLCFGYDREGDEEGDEYWWLKNSWGVDWGIDDFMKMKKGVGLRGIGRISHYPILYDEDLD